MAYPLGTALSRGAETERDLKTGERLTREDRRRLGQEKAAGDRKEALVEQKRILDFTKPPNTSAEVANDDEWGECAVVKKQSWVDCPCGNPVENQGDTFCEVCIARAGRGRKNHNDLSRHNEWKQEFRRMLIAESEQERDEEKKGITRSRGSETERQLRSSERFIREDRMHLAKEAGGEKQRLFLDLVNPPTDGDEVVDDEVWGKCRVVSREPWVDCPCGNPVKIRGDTLCEVCKVLGVGRRMVIGRGRRRDTEGEDEGYLYPEAPNAHEWYSEERKNRRARERGVEPSDSDNDGNQSAAVSRTGTDNEPMMRGKESRM